MKLVTSTIYIWTKVYVAVEIHLIVVEIQQKSRVNWIGKGDQEVKEVKQEGGRGSRVNSTLSISTLASRIVVELIIIGTG